MRHYATDANPRRNRFHTLTVFQQVRIAECTVGDDTGVITLTARNGQVRHT
jgi:hypothetical protein